MPTEGAAQQGRLGDQNRQWTVRAIARHLAAKRSSGRRGVNIPPTEFPVARPALIGAGERLRYAGAPRVEEAADHRAGW